MRSLGDYAGQYCLEQIELDFLGPESYLGHCRPSVPHSLLRQIKANLLNPLLGSGWALAKIVSSDRNSFTH